MGFFSDHLVVHNQLEKLERFKMSLLSMDDISIHNEVRCGVARSYGEGTRKTLSRVELDSGIFETVSAAAGPFSSTFRVYAMIMSRTPSFGPLVLNGTDIVAPNSSQRCFSLFCPGDVISGCFSEDVIYDILYLDPEFIESVISNEVCPDQFRFTSCTRATTAPVLVALWERISCVIEGGGSQERNLAEACAKLLVLHLAEPQLLNIAGSTLHRKDRTLGRAVDYIENNLAISLNLESIAQSVGVSTFHLCRMFRRGTGLSVRQFVIERRLEKARHLLGKTDQSICCIAHDCGFSSQSHMTTVFRKRFGTTPNAFRNGGAAIGNSEEHSALDQS